MVVTDKNGNSCAHFYTRNTTNSSTHLDSVLQILNHLASLNYERVAMGAYLDKCLFTSSSQESRFQNVIYPLVTRKNENLVVFVYDIDDITMLSRDHFAELKALAPHVDWRLLQSAIERLLSKLDCSELYDVEEVFDGSLYNTYVLAPKYEALRNLYNDISKKFDRNKSIICEELFEEIGIIKEDEKSEIRKIVVKHQKLFNQRWKTIEKCLQLVKTMPTKYANVVLCRGSITEAVTELLFSGHASSIGIEEVHSINDDMLMDPVFARIKKRLGGEPVMIHVTSYWKNYRVQELNFLPVWWISSNQSVKQLYKAQRYLQEKEASE